MSLRLELARIRTRSRVAGIMGVLSLLGATIYWGFWGREEILAFESPIALATPAPDDLWYMPHGGPLVAIGHDDQSETVWIRKWARKSEKPTIKILGFASKLRARPQYSLGADLPGRVGKYVSFVVAPDTKAIAWAWDGVLWSQDVDSNVAIPLNLNNKTQVKSLAFIKRDKFAILYEGGSLRIRKAGDDPSTVPGTEFASSRTLIWNQGERPIISSFDTAGVYAFDFRATMNFTTLASDSHGSVVSTTPSGKIAVGTSDGLVHFYQPPNSAGVDVGSVNALAFYNDNEVIAGGTGPGLFLVKSRPGIVDSVTPIRSAKPNNVRLLAVSGPDIAFVTPTAVITGTLKVDKVETPNSALVWKWVLGFISLLAFTMALLRDSKE